MEDMEEVGEAELYLSSSFPPTADAMGGVNILHLYLSVCASLFHETGAKWDSLRHYECVR